RGGRMRPCRVAVLALVAMFAWAGVATAAVDADLRPHHFKKRAAHWQADMKPGQPGPATARGKSVRIKVLGHHDPGGPSGDVFMFKRFAYMGSWGLFSESGEFCRALGVRTYDLSNPRDPELIATFADGASDPRLAKSWTEKVQVRKVRTKSFRGHLAVVSFQDCAPGGFTGIGLYDVTDPSDPELLSLRQSGIFGVHELWLESRGPKVYVYEAANFHEVDAFFAGEDPDEVNPEFRIVDVSDPRNPVQVGDWSAWRDMGVTPVEGIGTFPFNFVHSVYVAKKIAYVSYWDFGTVMLDVRDPSSPVFLGRTEYAEGEEGNAHSAWTARGGKILIQNDEDFDPTPNPDVETAWGYGRIFDISDKANPVQLATLKLPSTHQFPPPGPGDFTIHDPKVRGNKLYTSWYTEGVVIWNIANPANPKMIGQFIPPEKAEDPLGIFFPGEEFVEIWGIDIGPGFAVASDMNTGLWVFKVR
ncbi:MAG: LVIVD repeat-containing protein, partial [Gaiellaceae bacterium]